MPLRIVFAMLVAAIAVPSLPVLGQKSLDVYLGTYTGENSKGIYQCDLNLSDGTLSQVRLVVETANPSFLAFDPNYQFLYAVNEREATISAFAMDQSTGKWSFLNSRPSQGGAPCHLIVDRSGRHVLAANYSGGSCLSIPIEADGQLGATSSFQQHQGLKKNGHSIHLDHANKFALCCDLGLDKVIIYGFDARTGALTPHSEMSTPKGTGPRHFAWHPDGKTAFVNGETNLTIMACDFDAEQGTLTQKQVLSTLAPETVKAGGSTAEVVVHPSGKFVYVSNRDPYNSIAIFSIDPQTHALTAIGHQRAGIKTPRNFAIEPTGQYMLIANQSGNDVIVFRIDQSSGALIPTNGRAEISMPVCVRFRPVR